MLRAALLLVLAAVAACGDAGGQVDGRGHVAAGGGNLDGEQARWERLPDAPLSARHGSVAAWTRHAIVVIGGRDTDPCPPGARCVAPPRPPLRDGASFDPATAEWTPIADAPVPVASPAQPAIVAGKVFMLIGPYTSDQDDKTGEFIAYDPIADTWETLPAPAVESGTGLRLVAAGDKLVAYQQTQERGYAPDLVFDPASRSWSTLPRDLLALSFDRTMVWTGDHLVLLGKEAVANPGSKSPSFVRAARLAGLDGGDWERLTDSEVIGWNFGIAGGKIVSAELGGADGGETNPYGRVYPFGGMLDPDTLEWEPLPGEPPTPEQAYASGGQVYESSMPIAGGDIVAIHGYVLHVPSGTWIPLPRPPGGPQGGGGQVVAGERIIAFGGYSWSDDNRATLLDDAWVWAPPEQERGGS